MGARSANWTAAAEREGNVGPKRGWQVRRTTAKGTSIPGVWGRHAEFTGQKFKGGTGSGKGPAGRGKAFCFKNQAIPRRRSWAGDSWGFQNKRAWAQQGAGPLSGAKTDYHFHVRIKSVPADSPECGQSARKTGAPGAGRLVAGPHGENMGGDWWFTERPCCIQKTGRRDRIEGGPTTGTRWTLSAGAHRRHGRRAVGWGVGPVGALMASLWHVGGFCLYRAANFYGTGRGLSFTGRALVEVCFP